jgi:hypothetical protein
VRHLRVRNSQTAIVVPQGQPRVRLEDVAVEAGVTGIDVGAGHLFADGLVVTGTKPGAVGIYFEGIDAELHNVTMSDGSLDRGIAVGSGWLAVEDATIRARHGARLYGGAATITRARIDAADRGIITRTGTSLELADSVVAAHGATAPAMALEVKPELAGPATATVLRSTLVAVGPYARAVDVSSVDTKANVALVGSIAAAQGDGAADIGVHFATVIAKRSAYRTVDTGYFSPVPAPGTEGNLAVAPGFANPAAGDWSLAQDPPLVDAGDPAALPADIKDAAGAPRMADGNGDGTARIDLGGLEHVFKAPTTTGGGDGGAGTGGGGGGGETGAAPDTTAAVVANLRVRRRTARVRFTLGEAARVTVKVTRRRGGRTRVIRRVERDAAAGPVAVRVKRRAIRVPGRYRVTVRAVDAAGNAALPVRAAFRVR